MLKIKELIIIATLLIFMAGCTGSNNSDPTQEEQSLSDVTIVLLETTSTITTSNEIINIDVTAIDGLNNPYQDGNITIEYPDDIREGRDIGSFTSSTVLVNNGLARFTYTGPTNLSANISDLVFKFYHSSKPTLRVEYTIKILPEEAPSPPTLVLVETSSTITMSNEVINIDVSVIDDFNYPYQDGNVTIVYPDDIKKGRDIGSFTSATVPVNNGLASFTYTAPTNLSEDNSDIVFGFYHSASPNEKVEYTLKIAAAQIQNIYSLNIKSSDDDFFIPLEESESFSFFISDDKDNLPNDESMISLEITMLNSNLGILSYENTKATTLKINAKNNVSIKVETNTVSGVIPLKVNAQFRDTNNEVKTISETFNILVLSGPPSAISLSYAGTSLEKQDYAKFVEKWVLTVTDRYNNLVNTKPSVSMGMLAGYAQDSSNTALNSDNYLYFTPSQGNGTINASEDSFTATVSAFQSVDATNNYLVTFGDGYTYNASGKWSINTTDDGARLDLVDDYSGETTSGLGFAVGNNFRQDKSEEGVEWLGNVYPEAEGNYTMPSSGSMRINVEYDYYLTGKDVMLWANLLGKHYKDDTTVRIGEAKKVTLRANGISPDVESQTVPPGASNASYRFNIRINDTIEWYEHANFGAVVETSEDVFVNSIRYSDKDDDRTAYIIVTVTNTDPDASGSLSVTDTLVADEF